MVSANNFPPILTDNLSAIIPSGDSLSTSIDLKGTTLAGISIPATWAAANITLRHSFDGTNFQDIFSESGEEMTIIVAKPDIIVTLELATTAAIRFLQLRSGTSAIPVTQVGNQLLRLITRPA